MSSRRVDKLITGKKANAHCQQAYNVKALSGPGKRLGIGVTCNKSVENREQERVSLMPFHIYRCSQVDIYRNHSRKTCDNSSHQTKTEIKTRGGTELRIVSLFR